MIPDQTRTVFKPDPITGRWVVEPLQYPPRIAADVLRFFGVLALAWCGLFLMVVLGGCDSGRQSKVTLAIECAPGESFVCSREVFGVYGNNCVAWRACL